MNIKLAFAAQPASDVSSQCLYQVSYVLGAADLNHREPGWDAPQVAPMLEALIKRRRLS